MHGLTGGSWKRSADLTMVIEKNSPGGKPHGLKWLRDLPSTDPTAPAPDPPSDVIGELLPASGASGGNSEAAWWWGAGCSGCPPWRIGLRRRW